jgi:polysaccharide biosynthesis protein PslG
MMERPTYTPKHLRRPRHARSTAGSALRRSWHIGLVMILSLGLAAVLPAGAFSTAGHRDTGRSVPTAFQDHRAQKHIVKSTTTTSTEISTTTTAPMTTIRATTTTGPAAAMSEVSGLEVGVNWHAGWGEYSDARNRAIVDQLAAAGVTWVRLDLGWADVFPDGPTPTAQSYVDKIDRAVGYANSRGIKVLGIWLYTPPWANGGKGRFDPPTNVDDYARSARWAASHWKGRIQAWEVWNEPDLTDIFWHGTQDQYVALLKGAYPAFHEGDSSTTVVLAGPSSNDDRWIGELYAKGAKSSFDVLATHPYQGKADEPPEHPDDGHRWWFTHLPAVRDVMLEYGDGAKKVWLTEFGWSSHPNQGGEAAWQLGVTEQQQADYLVRAIRYARANYPYVTNMLWYQARDEAGNRHDDHFGLFYPDLGVKPAYTALRAALVR